MLSQSLVLLLLGCVVMVLLLRGLYAVLQARRGQVRLAIDRNIPRDVDLDLLEMAELPGGGAREVTRDQAAAESEQQDQAQHQAEAEVEEPYQDPPAVPDAEVSVATDVIDGLASVQPDYPDTIASDEADAVDEYAQPQCTDGEPDAVDEPDKINEPDGDEAAAEPDQQDHYRSVPAFDPDAVLDEFSMTAGERIGYQPAMDDRPEASQSEAGDSKLAAPTDQDTKPADMRQHQIGSQPTEIRQQSPLTQPSEVIVINVMAGEGKLFSGNELLHAAVTCGLTFGDMNIFHLRCGPHDKGPVLFSLANILNPGTFDLNNMTQFSTVGVSLFLALPAVESNFDAFEQMLTVAQRLCELLDGELRDDQRNVMTTQTIEHYRQRVRDFELRQMKAAGSRG